MTRIGDIHGGANMSRELFFCKQCRFPRLGAVHQEKIDESGRRTIIHLVWAPNMLMAIS